MARKMSEKESEKFIDAFEQRDCLWRTTSPEYCDRNVRLKAASEIGSTCAHHTSLDWIGLDWRGDEVAFNMSKQQATCSIRHSTCRMLQVACCFDMSPVAVRHVASTCCWCGRGFR